jgi:antitoxin (DNA-binding transcriptional repressor) of toxin-antitoxin stability system
LLCDDLVVTKLNVHEAKTHLSRYLEQVSAGETILLCRRNHVIAEIRPVRAPREKPRPVALAKGQFSIPPEFFDPLPDEILSYFTNNV